MARNSARQDLDQRMRKAKQLLAGRRGVIRDDSDDELGEEDYPWEYLYSQGEPEIIGAKMGSFQCFIGDAVLLKAEGTNEAWVGLICQFGDLAKEESREYLQGDNEKAAYFMWFSTDQEIRNQTRKRPDCLPHEVYITPSWDWNPLTTINGKANILSYEEFSQQFPSLQVPRASAEFGKTFICRRGCNTRTAIYTEEFDWRLVYTGAQDIHSLVDLVKKETWSSRRRKVIDHHNESNHVSESLGSLEPLAEQTTPSKKRKINVGTPKRIAKITNNDPFTPRHKRFLVKKPLQYSPLATRILSPQHTSSPYQKARHQLHVSSVPSSLPCREEAFATVYGHLESAIIEGMGSCIYISGTPGTGKTATVREVIHRLDAAVQNEELDDFIFVEINGMKMTEPQQAYVQLWQALRGENVSSAHALDLLEREFNNPNPRRVPCVVLMDELDQLVTRNQSVMYNFFNWPSLKHSRLIVLAVANTMDLPERTLSNKISSRLGLIRIPFAGYTHTDLMQIIQSRLQCVPGNIVDPDAVQFASRKVAAVSGDARRALDICRRAVEIAEADSKTGSSLSPSNMPRNEHVGSNIPKSNHQRVTIATIKRAITESTSNASQQALRGLTISAKLILAALVACSRRTGLAEAMISDIVEHVRRLVSISDEAWIRGLLLPQSVNDSTPSNDSALKKLLPRPAGLSFAAEELIECGIITMESRRGDRTGRVRLIIGEDEIRSALKEDHQIRGVGFAA